MKKLAEGEFASVFAEGNVVHKVPSDVMNAHTLRNEYRIRFE